MKTLQVKSAASMTQIEEYIGIVQRAEYKLRLPNSIKYGGGLGIEAAIIQLISTWARNIEEPTLHTYVKSEHRLSGFSSLCENLYGISAIALAKIILCDEIDVRVNKSEALAPAAHRINETRQLNFGSAYKGFKVNLACVKSGSYNGLTEPLYNNGKIVGQSFFKEIILKSIASIVPSQSKLSLISDEVIIKLSLAIRQLFLNTDQHARTDVNGNEYLRDVRAITLKCVDYSLESALNVSDSKELESYFRLIFPRAKSGNITFLEVSVIDCGPGFAGRWLSKSNKELAWDAERNAIAECFMLHSTTKPSSESGHGLDTVLRILNNLNGMFRLRTSRSIVERGYYLSFDKYNIETRHIREANSAVTGSAFTFIIPMLGRQNAKY